MKINIKPAPDLAGIKTVEDWCREVTDIINELMLVKKYGLASAIAMFDRMVEYQREMLKTTNIINQSMTVDVVKNVKKEIEKKQGKKSSKLGSNTEATYIAWDDFYYFAETNGYDLGNSYDYDDAITEYHDYLEDMAENKKEKKAMYTETDLQRQHLKQRAYDVFYLQEKTLNEKFNLRAKLPQGDLEKIEWVQNKWFRTEEQTDYSSGKKKTVVIWGDPKKTPDFDGHKAAREKLQAAHTTLMDDIAIKTPAEGLDALRAFEQAKFA